MPVVAVSSQEEHKSQAPPRKTKRKEQWLEFQKVWLANLRREVLGTEDAFGNPYGATDSIIETSKVYLPDPIFASEGKRAVYTLILDLDETLVHTEFDQQRGWITHRRPGVEAFLRSVSAWYEVICFTSGLKAYASPIMDQLDPPPSHFISHRLYREHTLPIKGMHVKDLGRLNRDLTRTIIIDNSPESYLLQPENAIPIKPFFGDERDTCLADLLPLLHDIVRRDVKDVRTVLKKCHSRGRFSHDASKPTTTKQPRTSQPHAAAPPGPPVPAPDRRISDIGPGRTDEWGDAYDDAPAGGSLAGRAPRWSLGTCGDVRPDPLADDVPATAVGGGWAGDADATLRGEVSRENNVAGLAHAGGGHGAQAPPHGHGAAAHPHHFHLSRGVSDSAVFAAAAAHTHAQHAPAGAPARSHSDVSPQPHDDLWDGAGASAAAAAAACGIGVGGAGRGGQHGGGGGEGKALLDWSAAHGAFAEVLRGMSPPSGMPLPDPDGSGSGDGEP